MSYLTTRSGTVPVCPSESSSLMIMWLAIASAHWYELVMWHGHVTCDCISSLIWIGHVIWSCDLRMHQLIDIYWSCDLRLHQLIDMYWSCDMVMWLVITSHYTSWFYYREEWSWLKSLQEGEESSTNSELTSVFQEQIFKAVNQFVDQLKLEANVCFVKLIALLRLWTHFLVLQRHLNCRHLWIVTLSYI